MRSPLNQAAGVVASAVAFTLHAVRQGKNDVAFTATVSGLDSGGAAVTLDVAGDDGKIRTFKDADDLMKAATTAGMMSGSVTLNVDGLDILAPRPFTGDAIKKATSQVAQLTKRQTDAAARVTKITTELTLMQQDPSVPASLVAERQAQHDAVVAYGVWLGGEITRINAILAG